MITELISWLYGHRSNLETHWGCQFGWKQLTEFDVVLAVILKK